VTYVINTETKQKNDESNDMNNIALLLIIIQGITESFEVVEELASVESLHGTTIGDLFLSLCETMKVLQLPWTKLRR
jgi:hypothetical protein